MFIDLNKAIEIAGGNTDAAHAFIDEFIQDLPNMLNRVSAAHTNKDSRVLEDEVHKLHGAASYAAVPIIIDITKNLEKAVVRGKTERVERYYAELKKAINALMENKDNPFMDTTGE